jgi:hypothetical protein
MTESNTFEDRIAEQLRVYAALAERPPSREAVANAVEAARNVHGVQRRLWRPARRSNRMNTYAKLIVAAAAVLVVAVVGYQFLPRSGGVGGQPTIAPSPSPTTLARGDFTSHGVVAQIHARGSGPNVTGTLTLNDAGNRATVDLECSKTTDGGLIEIGGLVTESTFDDYFAKGHRVAIIFQPGSPVKGVWWVSFAAEAPVASCQTLVNDVIKEPEVSTDLEPIEGTVELAP